MANQAPYKILVAPMDIYIGPLNPQWPDVDEIPQASNGWMLLGSLGAEYYGSDGVDLDSEQNIEEILGSRSTGVLKATRTTEGVSLKVTLMDSSLEYSRLAFNNNPVTDQPATSGHPGYKQLPLYRGTVVKYFSVLGIGNTPYSGDDNAYRQIRLPQCYFRGNFTTKYNKGAAATTGFEFRVVMDSSAPFEDGRHGWIVDYTAAAL